MLIKGTLLPVIYLVILFVFFSVLLKSGLSKYQEQRKLIKQTKAVENILKDKIAFLTENQSMLRAGSDTVSAALPEKNPALIMMSQIKSLQLDIPVVILDTRVANVSQINSARNALGLTLTVEGEMNGITNFVEKIMGILPIVLVNRMEITGAGGRYSANIKITAFYEKLPTKIPPITDPIIKMSKDDLALVTRLQTMKMPGFAKMIPQSPSTRINPFR